MNLPVRKPIPSTSPIGVMTYTIDELFPTERPAKLKAIIRVSKGTQYAKYEVGFQLSDTGYYTLTLHQKSILAHDKSAKTIIAEKAIMTEENNVVTNVEFDSLDAMMKCKIFTINGDIDAYQVQVLATNDAGQKEWYYLRGANSVFQKSKTITVNGKPLCLAMFYLESLFAETNVTKEDISSETLASLNLK